MHRLIPFIFFLVISCNNPKTPPLPDLPDKEMIRILADLHMAEIAAKKVHPTKKDSFLNVYYNQVYQIHHISKEKFEKEFEKLRKNPEKLEDIYKKSLDYVTVMSEQ